MRFTGILAICLALTLSDFAVGNNCHADKSSIRKKGVNETTKIDANQISTDGQIVTYTDNVSISSCGMTVQRADKATLDIKTKKLTIWNTNKKFRVDIATGDQDCNFSKGRVEYTPESGVVLYATLPD